MNEEFTPKKEQLKFSKMIWYFLGGIIAYVLLFEFILPANDIIPAPSLLLESLAPLWNNYHFFEALAITTSVIYISLVLGYLIISISAGTLIKLLVEYTQIVNGFRLFRYFPIFFAVVIFVFWFNYSIYAEFLFALLYVLITLTISLYNSLAEVKEVYINAAKGLDTPKNKIYSKVIWKNCQPKVFKNIFQLHVNLWLIALIYEYISENGGFGTIFKMTLNYNDFAGLVTLAVILSLLTWLGTAIIKFIEKKLIFWEA